MRTRAARDATFRIVCATILLPGIACHDLFDGVFPNVCEPADEASLAPLPDLLSATGLYAAPGTLAPGVMPYRPRFELWSDGATKRRWLWLPPDERIDTRDPDDWILPEGTKIWKEFARDGVVVETRLIARIGDRWSAQAYVWTDDGSDAIASPAGFVDARGTEHDVPAAGECGGCHGGRRSFALGVSAVQLAHEAPAGELDLEELVATERLTDPVPTVLAVPGDATASAALGYLHANCGHCHSAAAPAKPCLDPDNDLDFWLRIDTLASVTSTPAYTSAVDGAIRPGQPDRSPLVDVISTRDLFTRMPPLGSRLVDPGGIDLLRRWIAELP